MGTREAYAVTLLRRLIAPSTNGIGDDALFAETKELLDLYDSDNPKHPSGTMDVDIGVFDRMVPLPSVDLVQALQSAVVRSVDEDESASAALEKLQNRVLMAVARFECAMVIT